MKRDEMPESIERMKKEKDAIPQPFNHFKEWINGDMELETESVYLVNVKQFAGNPLHAAILFTGKSNGAYSSVWQHSYETPSEPYDMYHIEVVEKLTEMPNHGPVPSRGNYDEA